VLVNLSEGLLGYDVCQVHIKHCKKQLKYVVVADDHYQAEIGTRESWWISIWYLNGLS
jgi:hypothetical protein